MISAGIQMRGSYGRKEDVLLSRDTKTCGRIRFRTRPPRFQEVKELHASAGINGR